MTQPLWRGLLFALLALCIQSAGCAQKEQPIPASIVGLNYTEKGIDLYVDGTWGGRYRSYEGGGSLVCCVLLPEQYRPGLTAKVRWRVTHCKKSGITSYGTPYVEGCEDTWKERIVSVPPYDKEGGDFYVHVYPDDHVEVYVSNFGPQHPDYPGPHVYPSQFREQLKAGKKP